MNNITRRQLLIAGTTVALPVGLGCGGRLESLEGNVGAEVPPENAPHGSSPGVAAGPPRDPRPADAGSDDAADAVDASTVDSADGSVATQLSIPGLVVEVAHPGSVVSGKVQAGEVRPIVMRGMTELTGTTNERAAWRALFSADDVVALKVNPFGWPTYYSRPETLIEIIRGLNLAGIPNGNVIIYDRYSDYLAQVGYAALLPSGIRFASAVLTTAAQTSLEGCDPATFVEFSQVDTGLDPSVAQNRRSYLCDVVANQVTKVINVPVLKSHWTAGVTCALKNMTYGLVNNTARTHAATNWTKDFAPAVASLAALRKKVVLHVADLLVACANNGPDPGGPSFDYQSLAFATDPVALDRVCWKILDEQRAKMGLGPVASMPGTEPEYILNCGAAVLGVSDLTAIDHRRLSV